MSESTNASDFIEPSNSAAGQQVPAEDLDEDYQEEPDEQSDVEGYEPGDYSGGRERLDRRRGPFEAPSG